MQSYSLTHVSDQVLLRDLAALVARDRLTLAELLAHIAEVDTRRLYLPAGCSSMYAYCVEELHLSEDAASKRIQAARAARRFPVVFSAVAEGRLHLTAVCLLAPYLTVENFGELIEAAAYRRKFEIEDLLARRFGRTSGPSVGLWALTAPQTGSLQHALAHVGGEAGPGGDQHALAHVEASGDQLALGTAPISGGDQHAPAHVEGTPSNQASPERYLLQVAIARGTREKLRHAQVLLSHAVPGGDMAEVLDRALDALIVQLETRKFGAVTRRLQRASRRRRTTARNRYVPAHVRRAVWERDQGRCTFVSASGKRCAARRLLEFDHIEPVARGGRATVEGIRLRCRAHNQYEAERVFGTGFMIRKRQVARMAAARMARTEGRAETGVRTTPSSP
jgi:5-methylcytosine-specific restriction endonuclease McrA